jgi:hypothetical protein
MFSLLHDNSSATIFEQTANWKFWREGKAVPAFNYLKYYSMNKSGGIATPFLTSALNGGEWSASCPCRSTPETLLLGSWVGPGIGLDAVEK